MLFGKTIDELTIADIERLVTDRVREDRQLDYKAALPGGADRDKKEFAADVSSFANASGGFIIFGIVEEKDDAGQNTGIAASTDGLPDLNADQTEQRLHQMMRTSIDPRVPGIRTKVLDAAMGQIVVLHIPRSWAGPHMVTVAGDSRFYSRSSVGKHQLDVHEIRSAFSLSADIAKRIRRFRDERLGRIVADETPVRLGAPARLVVHLMPFIAMNDDANIDVVAWADNYPKPMAWHSSNGPGFNVEGLFVFGRASDGTYHSYLQVFRSGILESAMLLYYPDEGKPLFRPWLFEKDIFKWLREAFEQYQRRGIEAPFVIAISFLGVKGAVLPRSIRSGGPDRIVDRDTLILPDVLLREYNEDLPTLMRPTFDAMWQAAGVATSKMYDKEGRWSEDNYMNYV